MKVSQVELVYKSRVKASERPVIKSSRDSFRLFLKYWSSGTIELLEEFKCMYLNRSNGVLAISDNCKGGITSVTVDKRLICAIALKLNAVSLIVCHNHPSGALIPSDADRDVTRGLIMSANCMDFDLLDHLIISKAGYFSFSDHGLISHHGNRAYAKQN